MSPYKTDVGVSANASAFAPFTTTGSRTRLVGFASAATSFAAAAISFAGIFVVGAASTYYQIHAAHARFPCARVEQHAEGVLENRLASFWSNRSAGRVGL
jgi:hypothetical protein